MSVVGGRGVSRGERGMSVVGGRGVSRGGRGVSAGVGGVGEYRRLQNLCNRK